MYCGSLTATSAAVAGDDRWTATIEAATPAKPWRESTQGMFVSPQSVAVYSSTTSAPLLGTNFDGFRLRTTGGYSRYSYVAIAPHKPDCQNRSGERVPIHGRVTFSDILAGYQFSHGQMTVKAFAGAALDTQSLSQRDACNAAAGLAYGFKGAIETWIDLMPHVWLSMDGNWSQVHNVYGVQSRLGYRLTPDVAIGIEQSAVGNVAGHHLRSGVFGRLTWSWGEARLAGGVSIEDTRFADIGRDNAWAALDVMVRY